MEKVFGESCAGRNELMTIIRFLRPCDELVLTRLDRLGRDTRDVLNIVSECDQHKAFGTVLDPHVTTRSENSSNCYRPRHGGATEAAAPLVFVGRRTSELTKYAANAFLATKITFINEIADLCEKVGADVQDVARGIGLDKRIGGKFLHAGPGYGGSCFPKDTLALIKTGQDEGAALRIVETVVAVNDARKRAMARKVINALGGSVRGKKIALLGLAFKPNTDDMRDAPSLAIVASLAGDGARPLMPEVTFHDNAYSALEGADALAIVTEWDAFRALDLDRVRSLLKQPIIVDLRNVYRPGDVRKRGFTYVSVGRV
ncbi:hypothetical protein C5688_18940 [Methylocystis sp. MitZ-2018]|nr:hypothetical protein C5688_18940 [Methylocystis sp. MitZ-2018]